MSLEQTSTTLTLVEPITSLSQLFTLSTQARHMWLWHSMRL